MLRLELGVQPVLLVGVAVADVQPDVVAGVVRFVIWDDMHVVACVKNADGACFRRGGAGGGAFRRLGRRARCRLRGACNMCFLLPGGGGGGAAHRFGWRARCHSRGAYTDVFCRRGCG